MLLKARLSAFISGAAISGAFAVFKLRQDLLDSQEVLLDQARKFNVKDLEQRVAQLEASVQDSQEKK